MTLARISVTLPPDLVKAADRRARELDRSRSWIVTEALSRYLGAPGSVGGVQSGRDAVYESARDACQVRGLGDYRLAQLEADLALSPEQRIREAEATARTAEMKERAWRGDRVLMFDRYEDYLAWERRADLPIP